jgi:hypothetical protein
MRVRAHRKFFVADLVVKQPEHSHSLLENCSKSIQ